MMDVITYPRPLKIESRYDANFVVTSGIGGCRYNDEKLGFMYDFFGVIRLFATYLKIRRLFTRRGLALIWGTWIVVPEMVISALFY